jgi:phosphohistidine phosphatase
VNGECEIFFLLEVCQVFGALSMNFLCILCDCLAHFAIQKNKYSFQNLSKEFKQKQEINSQIIQYVICNLQPDKIPLFMKTLLLVRHAKSSWGDITLSDFERPLNDRGKSDAPKMGKRLKKKGIKIDAFISSPAKRARKTAEYFIEEYKGNKDDIIFVSSLYDASVNDFNAAVRSFDDKYDTIALFSHNPGITHFANELFSGAEIDNMPTCSVFAVSSPADKWKDFLKNKKEFLFFEYPKKEE